MKQFLAVFIGTEASMAKWQTLSEAERRKRMDEGKQAWHEWSARNEKVIGSGSPLGKTKKVDDGGISDIRNNLTAWTVVEAESQEAAAKLFLGHPHFNIFPGDSVEIMECLPIPT